MLHDERVITREREIEAAKHPVLVALGERARMLRARRGMTRKAVAQAANVSERHLANLEYGVGNASILVLQQVATALQCSLAELLGDVTTSSPEWLMIRELLERRDDVDLRRARVALSGMFDSPAAGRRDDRIALVGLRGAGKTTLGPMLADDLGLPFVELSREIERLAGGSLSEIHALYGTSAYRRYERRALEDTIQRFPEAVIATPGGLVSDPATFNLLLANCFTVWLQASPEDHMRPRRRAGRLAADGCKQGSDGGPASHPVRTRGVLFESGPRDRYQRGAAGRDVPGIARQRAAGAGAPGLAGT